MSVPDFMAPQINRGALVAATLDITLDQWMRRLRVLSDDDIPKELQDQLVGLVGALKVQSELPADASFMSHESRGDYLQALVTLSDPALRWIVETFGLLPDNLMDESNG